MDGTYQVMFEERHHKAIGMKFQDEGAKVVVSHINPDGEAADDDDVIQGDFVLRIGGNEVHSAKAALDFIKNDKKRPLCITFQRRWGRQH
jgi:C-terminal processing protease CtpA/Prc